MPCLPSVRHLYAQCLHLSLRCTLILDASDGHGPGRAVGDDRSQRSESSGLTAARTMIGSTTGVQTTWAIAGMIIVSMTERRSGRGPMEQTLVLGAERTAVAEWGTGQRLGMLCLACAAAVCWKSTLAYVDLFHLRLIPFYRSRIRCRL
jgi:hypothetical protein